MNYFLNLYLPEPEYLNSSTIIYTKISKKITKVVKGEIKNVQRKNNCKPRVSLELRDYRMSGTDATTVL